jgi:PAS domain S-box-containing protein
LRPKRQLADFLENAAEGLHQVDSEGVVLWANQAELEMLGYDASEYIGHNIAEFHANQQVISRMLERLKQGETLKDEPARMRCKDGSLKPVLINSNAFFAGAKLVYTRCCTRDATAITEKERIAEELAEANRAKDEFLAMLGHELRNPLTPIVSALSLLRAKDDGSNAEELRVIRRQVDHMVRLLNDLTDAVRMNTSKIQLHKSCVSVADVALTAIEMVSPLILARGHHLESDIPPDLTLFADEMRLCQVMSNLLNNAVKYTPDGGRIWLQARAQDGEIRVSVRDTGRGMSEEVRSRVFESFYQAPQAARRAEGGLGIGLALVDSFVKLHGGSVEAHSAGPNLGSEFVVRLPVGEPGSVPQVSHSNSGNSPYEPTVRQACRIAVIDDNVDAAYSLGEVLNQELHEVRTYGSPDQLLLELEEFRPDVVTMDIGLRGMDGYVLAKSIRARLAGRSCLLIAVTGRGQEEDRRRSAEAGIDVHLLKPANIEELLELIQRHAGFDTRAPAHGDTRKGAGSFL